MTTTTKKNHTVKANNVIEENKNMENDMLENETNDMLENDVIENETLIDDNNDNNNNGTIDKVTYYLNKKPQKYDEINAMVVHWTTVESLGGLHKNSENFNTIEGNRKILSELYDTRFFSYLAERKVYCEVVLDKDYVLNQFAELINIYTSNNDELDQLLSEAENITEKLRQKHLTAELAQLAVKYNMSVSQLKKTILADGTAK